MGGFSGISRLGGPGVDMLQAAIVEGRPLRAALPRSTLHIKLLLDNAQALDVCFIRDDHMMAPAIAAFGGSVVHLGREGTMGRGRLNPLRVRDANARYYSDIGSLIDAINFQKLIIFLSTEPLEEFVVPRLPADRVEIWEDGLMHYVDMEGPLFRVRRRLAQRLCGFHVRRLAGSMIDKNSFRIRDRFREGSLVFNRPQRDQRYREEILFIGQPLVSDGMVALKAYGKGLAALVEAVGVPVRYLPHPRESDDDVRALTGAVGNGSMTIESDRRGVLEHCADWSYLAYLSPFSTALLDLGEVERSFWVAGLVRLGSHGRRLRSFEGCPIAMPESLDELVGRLSAVRPRIAALEDSDAPGRS